MTDADRQALWARVAGLLEQGRDALPDRDGVGEFFEEYLAHNELGLAFDDLVSSGHDQASPRRFWNLMTEAAAAMQLTVEHEIHGPAVRTVAEHLQGA